MRSAISCLFACSRQLLTEHVAQRVSKDGMVRGHQVAPDRYARGMFGEVTGQLGGYAFDVDRLQSLNGTRSEPRIASARHLQPPPLPFVIGTLDQGRNDAGMIAQAVRVDKGEHARIALRELLRQAKSFMRPAAILTR